MFSFFLTQGFVLRLDFLSALSHLYQRVQIFLEFYLRGKQNDVKCSWSHLYHVEAGKKFFFNKKISWPTYPISKFFFKNCKIKNKINYLTETYRTKRCLPYFFNIFKLPPQPALHLFIEVWGYDVKNPDANTIPVGRSQTTLPIFDEHGELEGGKFQAPLYIYRSHGTNSAMNYLLEP